MQTPKLLLEIQNREQIASQIFLLDGKAWQEIKEENEWRKWNGEKTTWENFLAQAGESLWSVDRRISCYEYFIETMKLSFDDIYQGKAVSSRNLIAIRGANFDKEKTTELLGVAREVPAAVKDRIRDFNGGPPEKGTQEKKEPRGAECKRKIVV